MTGETSQTHSKQLNDFLSETRKHGAIKIVPAELISSVIPRNQDRLARLVRNEPAPNTGMDEDDAIELFDSGENELYTR